MIRRVVLPKLSFLVNSISLSRFIQKLISPFNLWYNIESKGSFKLKVNVINVLSSKHLDRYKIQKSRNKHLFLLYIPYSGLFSRVWNFANFHWTRYTKYLTVIILAVKKLLLIPLHVHLQFRRIYFGDFHLFEEISGNLHLAKITRYTVIGCSTV